MTRTKSDVISMFMIFLVMTMPFYSASALAATVQITHNAGEQNIQGYLDAEGDVWTVKATVSGVPAAQVTPDKVTLSIGSNSDTFDTCSEVPTGMSCEYISDLSGGFSEANYDFQVEYLDAAGDADTIRLDGSAPDITPLTDLRQVGNKLTLDFTVTESGDVGVGIASVEIVDGAGTVLWSKTDFADGDRHFDYKDDIGGELDAPSFVTGEARKYVKVRATDRLGHQKVSSPVGVNIDAVPPEILTGTLSFDVGEFTGPVTMDTTMRINVSSTTAVTVTASSEQVQLLNAEGVCTQVEGVEHLYQCEWAPVRLSPGSSATVKIMAEDAAKNKVERSITETFTQDVQEPVVEFFGSSRVYNDESYVKNGYNKIVLRVREVGAGLEKNAIRANLGQLGVTGDLAPDNCTTMEGVMDCFWEVQHAAVSGDSVSIGLTKLTDKVGNEGEHVSARLKVDTTAPSVQELQVFGVGVEGAKDYFQSGDKLQFKLKVREAQSGLLFKVNLNDLVMDAENLYPETELNEAGWETFTEGEGCTQEGVDWKCEFTTEASLKSEYQRTADLELVLEDTVGNAAGTWPAEKRGRIQQRGTGGGYSFEKLANSDAVPDYWESARGRNIVLAPEFIDLDVTNLINTRMMVQVSLSSSSAEALLFTNPQCQPVSGQEVPTVDLSRVLMYGGVTDGVGRSTPTLMLEFAPFDGKATFGPVLEAHKQAGEDFTQVTVDYVCSFSLYSKVRQEALASGERQEITISIPFGFTEFGSKDENLEGKIQEIKDRTDYQILDKMAFLTTILKFVRLLGGVVQIVRDAYLIINIIIGGSDVWRNIVATAPLAVSTCVAGEASHKLSAEWLSVVQIPLDLLTCNPNPAFGSGYADYQQSVLNLFNLWKGAGFTQSRSLYDNIWTSMFGLCIPGIIYNMDKLRQSYCVQIACLERDVPAGRMTVEGCQKIQDVLSCKYFKGELVGLLIPGTDLANAIKELIKNLLTNPLGWIRFAAVNACGAICPLSGAGTAACETIAVLVKLGDIINNAVGLYQQFPTVGQDFCSQIKDEEEQPEPEADLTSATAGETDYPGDVP